MSDRPTREAIRPALADQRQPQPRVAVWARIADITRTLTYSDLLAVLRECERLYARRQLGGDYDGD